QSFTVLTPAGATSPGVDPQPGNRQAEGGRSDDVIAFPVRSGEIAEEPASSISVEFTLVDAPRGLLGPSSYRPPRRRDRRVADPMRQKNDWGEEPPDAPGRDARDRRGG